MSKQEYLKTAVPALQTALSDAVKQVVVEQAAEPIPRVGELLLQMSKTSSAPSAEFETRIKKLVRPVKGFPNPDFTFGDITPLLADGAAFRQVIDAFAERYKDVGLVAIAAPEARGFFFGPAVAARLGVGFLPVRKKDQLPGETHKSDLVKMDYGERCPSHRGGRRNNCARLERAPRLCVHTRRAVHGGAL